MSQTSLSRRLTRRVRDREARPDDLRAAERYVRDFLGSLVAGRSERPGRILLAYGGDRRDLEGEVFLAAVLGHVTETDDLHRASVTHPGCVVLPVALLLGSRNEASGPDTLRATLLGYEVMLRVGEALGPGHYRAFHNTATAGVFGSAAAAASLLDLDEDAWVWALGNAGTQAAGLWQFGREGAMSKHLHAGHAAVAGLRAALLARHGFTGPEAILEGEQGFFAGLCPDPEPDAVLRPADGWKLPETSMKPYPCCRHVHPAVDAALEVRRSAAFGDDERPEAVEKRIEEVAVRSYSTALRITDRPDPDTPYAAKFSIQHCVARTLLSGFPDLESFRPELLSEPPLQALLARTGTTVDDELDAAYPERWGAEVRVRTRDGALHTARIRDAKGDPEAPMDDRELDRKVRSLLAYGGMPDSDAEGLLERCRELPEGGELFSLPLRAARRGFRSGS